MSRPIQLEWYGPSLATKAGYAAIAAAVALVYTILVYQLGVAQGAHRCADMVEHSHE